MTNGEYELYAYDALGNRYAALDSQGDTQHVIRYNLLNLPEQYRDAGVTVSRVHDAGDYGDLHDYAVSG